MSGSKYYREMGAIVINGDVVHLLRDDEKMYAGIYTNAGFAPMNEIVIDPDLSQDENIDTLLEQV